MARLISWMRPALKDFQKFPGPAQDQMQTALRFAAQGQKAGIAKPMKGLGSGVFEIALPYQTDAYRIVYAVQLDEDIWVVHAFQKRATKGIKAPKKEIDLIRERLKRLKEQLR